MESVNTLSLYSIIPFSVYFLYEQASSCVLSKKLTYLDTLIVAILAYLLARALAELT